MAVAANGVTTEFTLNGSTPVQLAASISPNSSRHAVMVFNKDGVATVYIAFASGGTMPATTGIPIPPNGNLIFGSYDNQRLPSGDIWATTTGAATKVSITDYWT